MKIQEMTMRAGSFEKAAKEFAQTNQYIWKKDGEHIGDIEKYQVLKYKDFYSLWDNNTLVAFTSLVDNVVDDVYVESNYRGQKIFSKLLWFYKTRLDKSPLILGKIHSKDMQEVVKGLSRFEKYWLNTKTGEKKPFSKDTVDDFYSFSQITPWRLMLENVGEFNWPMFHKNGFVKESYDPYID